VLEGVRAAGEEGHSTIVCTLPEVDLEGVEGGVLALKGLRVGLDGRTSASVAEAVSVVATSLPMLLTLDTDYEAVRAHEEATLEFKRSIQSALLGLVLGVEVSFLPSGSVAGVNQAQLQQVLIQNISRGSTKVAFLVLDSPDGTWRANSVHELLVSAYGDGRLGAALSVLGNVTAFYAEGYVVTTSSTTTTVAPTTTSTTTTPAPTTTPVVTTSTTPPPEKTFWEENAVPLIGGGAGAGVLLLFSGLVVLIRRSLKSDEDLIKSAFSALARSAGNEEAQQIAPPTQELALMAAANQTLPPYPTPALPLRIQDALQGTDSVDPMSMSHFSTSHLDTSTAFMLSPRNPG